MFNPYTQFKRLYPKSIRIETAVIIFHIFRKTFLNIGRTMGDTSVSGGTALLFLCIFLNFWIVYRNKRLIIRAVRETKWFLLYVIFCFCSVFWSITGADGFSSIFAKDLEVLSSFLALSVILYKIKDMNLCVMYILYLVTIAALCGAIAQGFKHTNSYSVSGMIGAVLAVGIKKAYNPKYINYFVLANMICLILGTSSGTYISAICAFLVLFSTNKHGVKIAQVFVVSIVAYVLYELAYDTIFSMIFYGHDEYAIEGGTGRYEVWGQFIDGWKQSPWLGYGYVVGERNLALMGGREFIFSAHNGYLSVLINTGLVGAFIFLCFLVKTLFNGLLKSQINNPAQTNAAIFFAAFVGILVNNISYPLVGSDWNHTFPPMMMVLILMNTWKYKTVGIGMKKILIKKI